MIPGNQIDGHGITGAIEKKDLETLDHSSLFSLHNLITTLLYPRSTFFSPELVFVESAVATFPLSIMVL